MAGQGIVTIKDKQWQVDLAADPWELMQGLGGIAGIAPGTGMFFDLGYPQAITVTTEPMLFPLDVAFLSETLEVTEIYRNVQPGYLVNATIPARYFIEVNAGELDGIDAGAQAALEILALPSAAAAPDWIPMMASIIGFSLMGFLLVHLVNSITAPAFSGEKNRYYLSETKKKETLNFPKNTEVQKTSAAAGYQAGAPVASLSEKWQNAKARNSALAMKDLEALKPDYDTADCKEALVDYQEIEPGDYSDREEYQEARDEAWEAFIESLETLVGEEEEHNTSFYKCASCSKSNNQCEVCEKISPRYYPMLSWFGSPVPDYSFAVEPETKERKIDDVLKRLKEGVESIQQSDHFRQFLLTMSKFHDYSIGNLILIMIQKPDATHVAGFSTWKNLGRWVKQGAKGIAILAPCMPPKGVKPETTEDVPEGEQELEEEKELRPIFFKVVYVFNIDQTEGKPLPEFEVPVLTGDANEELFNLAVRLVKEQGLDLSFELKPEQDPDIKGMYFNKNIWVKPDESRAQQLKTLLHETAHYYTEGVFHIQRRDAETIAESVAFAVGAHFGFDTGTRSFPYVALWSKDKKILEENLSAIRKVSAKIIEALEQLSGKMVGVV